MLNVQTATYTAIIITGYFMNCWHVLFVNGSQVLSHDMSRQINCSEKEQQEMLNITWKCFKKTLSVNKEEMNFQKM